MRRLIVWWTVVLCLVAGSTFLRHDTRTAYASMHRGAEFSQRIQNVLTESGLAITGQAMDNLGTLVSASFLVVTKTCEKPMVVARFPITKLARPFAEDFRPYGENARFYYRDVAYTRSARVTLTLRWIESLLIGTVTGRDGAALRDQIMVLWPEGCEEPDVDWARAWDGPSVVEGS